MWAGLQTHSSCMLVLIWLFSKSYCRFKCIFMHTILMHMHISQVIVLNLSCLVQLLRREGSKIRLNSQFSTSPKWRNCEKCSTQLDLKFLLYNCEKCDFIYFFSIKISHFPPRTKHVILKFLPLPLSLN
jgi:hypothetical protein